MFRRFTFSFLVALLFVAVASVAMAAEALRRGRRLQREGRHRSGGRVRHAIAAFGGAMGPGQASAAGLEGRAQPFAQKHIFIQMIVGLALIESLRHLRAGIAFVLVGKL